MISVLMPTRGRPKPLALSIASLLDNARHRDAVEILLAIDPDEWEGERVITLEDFPPQVQVWVSPERYGYGRLQEYVNFLASAARGEWLLLWNDDAQMLTEGWDEVVHSYSPDQCLFMDAMYPTASGGDRGNIFPIWPRAWSARMGYVSLSPNNDVWISEVANRLGREVRIPVRAMHDRSGVMSTEADQTHLEGRALMGEHNDPEYDSLPNRLFRSREVRVIGSMLATESVPR